MKMTEEEKELKRAERRKAARIRYRMKCGKTYEEALAEDNGDTGNIIMIGDMKLSDMVTRPAYLRIYNRILHKTPELEAVEIERKNLSVFGFFKRRIEARIAYFGRFTAFLGAGINVNLSFFAVEYDYKIDIIAVFFYGLGIFGFVIIILCLPVAGDNVYFPLTASAGSPFISTESTL